MIFGALNSEETWHHYILHIIYVISKENKLLPLYPPYMKNVTALYCEIYELFHLTEDNVAFHHALLKSVHVATRRLRNMSVSRIGTRYTRSCSSRTRLYQSYLRWAWSKNQPVVLPRRVADAEAATAICSIGGDVFVFQQDNAPAHRARDTVESLRSETPQFISPDMWRAVQQSWPQPGKLSPLEHDARARISSTNPRYGQVAKASCCDMGWISAENSGRCSWSVKKKDWKHVSVQKVITFNTCCDVACLTCQLPHITTGSFQSHQCQPTTSSFQIHQRIDERNITFSQMKK